MDRTRNEDPQRKEINLAIDEALRLRQECPSQFDTLSLEIDKLRRQEAALMRPELFRTDTRIDP